LERIRAQRDKYITDGCLLLVLSFCSFLFQPECLLFDFDKYWKVEGRRVDAGKVEVCLPFWGVGTPSKIF